MSGTSQEARELLRQYGLTGRMIPGKTGRVTIDAFVRFGVHFPRTETSIQSLRKHRPRIMRYVDTIEKCHNHAQAVGHSVLSYTEASRCGSSNMKISVMDQATSRVSTSRSNNYFFQKKDPFLSGGFDAKSVYGGFFYCTLQLEPHPYVGIGITAGPYVEPRLVTHRYAGVVGGFDVWHHSDAKVAQRVETLLKKMALPKSDKRPKGFQTEAMPVGMQPYIVNVLEGHGMVHQGHVRM